MSPTAAGQGAGEAQHLLIDGGKGDDTITVTDGYDSFKPNAKDSVSGNQAPKDYSPVVLISAGEGNDIINAENADKTKLFATGGKGNDQISSGRAGSVIIDSKGSNTVAGSTGCDIITTGGGKDITTDKGGSNTIHAGGGDDEITCEGHFQNNIYGEDGSDTIKGGSGRDYIEGGSGSDKIYGSDGSDVIYAGTGSDYVEGGSGNDFINAGHGDDEVWGGYGNDMIFGLAGDDKLYGEEGTDTIAAGDGSDIADGGADKDIIRYTDSARGRDTLLNPEDGDDAAALDPIDVPNNFKVFLGESQAFKDNINDNLEAFAAIEPGQEMLSALDSSGAKVYFKSFDENNGYCIPTFLTGFNLTLSRDGSDDVNSYIQNIGCNSVIKLNPEFISFNSGSYAIQNSMIIMAHEMSHAYNNATGTMDGSYYSTDTGERMDLPFWTLPEQGFEQRAVRGAELQAVGIYDGSTLENPYGMSENDYRQYFHMAPRDSYMSQTVFQREAGNKGGQNWDEWRDYDKLAQDLRQLRGDDEVSTP